MFNGKGNKYLIGAAAVMLALVMVVGIGTQFGDSSLKATDEDENATPIEETTIDVQVLEIAPEEEEPAEAAEETVAPEVTETVEETAAEPETSIEDTEEAAEPENAVEETEEAVEPENAVEETEKAVEPAAAVKDTEEAAETEKPAEEDKKIEEDEETEEEKVEEDTELQVSIYFINLSEGKVKYGSRIQLISQVSGAPEGCELRYQWQCSTDGGNWVDVQNGNGATYEFVLDETNAGQYWRVLVDR